VKYLLLLLTLLASSNSIAGVTIHYSGTLASGVETQKVIVAATAYASSEKWLYQVDGDTLIIFPDPWCEPIHLSFIGSDLTQDFVKTQFAGPAVHIAVIGLFKTIEPSFSHLDILDEGEYWQSGDLAKLRANMEGRGPMR
jgi:hypothetical protein